MNLPLPDDFAAQERLSKETLEKLFSIGQVRRFDPDSYLIVEGTRDETVYLTLEGEFEVFKEFKDQRRTISHLLPGIWVGEMAFLRRVPRTASVVAIKPSRALVIEKKAFDTLDHATKLALIQRFNELAVERLELLIGSQEKPSDQRSGLMFNRATEQSQDLQRSVRLVQSVISNIPRLPVYAGNLISFLNDPDAPMDKIASLIYEDPSLAAQVLKNVNSPYYGFQQKVTDLKHAVTLLGTNQLYLLVLFNAMRATMPNTPAFINLQRHSVVMSYVASHVAAIGAPKKVPLASTLGLLHDIGKSVVLLMRHKHPTMADLFNILDHFNLGTALLMRWNLPEEIYESVNYQGLARYAPLNNIPDAYQYNVSMLAIAHLVTEILQGAEPRKPVFLDEYLDEAGFSGRTIEDVAKQDVLPALKTQERALPIILRNLLKQCTI